MQTQGDGGAAGTPRDCAVSLCQPCADSGDASHHCWLQVGDVRQLTSQVLAQLLVGQRLDVYVVECKVRLL